jgi:hypothetical protein
MAARPRQERLAHHQRCAVLARKRHLRVDIGLRFWERRSNASSARSTCGFFRSSGSALLACCSPRSRRGCSHAPGVGRRRRGPGRRRRYGPSRTPRRTWPGSKETQCSSPPSLTQMPKGGDLHHHLSGAVYAETYLGWAATANDCLETAAGDYYLSIDTCGYSGDVPIPASTAPLYTQAVEAMSMLNFVATPSQDGHDHFFATFDLFGTMSGTAHHGVSLADVETRAASENEVYIEPMLTSNTTAEDLGTSAWSTANGTAAMTASDFASFRTTLLASSTWGDGGQRHHDRHRQHRERRADGARLQRSESARRLRYHDALPGVHLAQRRGARGLRSDGGRVRSGEGGAAAGRAEPRGTGGRRDRARQLRPADVDAPVPERRVRGPEHAPSRAARRRARRCVHAVGGT